MGAASKTEAALASMYSLVVKVSGLFEAEAFFLKHERTRTVSEPELEYLLWRRHAFAFEREDLECSPCFAPDD